MFEFKNVVDVHEVIRLALTVLRHQRCRSVIFCIGHRLCNVHRLLLVLRYRVRNRNWHRLFSRFLFVLHWAWCVALSKPLLENWLEAASAQSVPRLLDLVHLLIQDRCPAALLRITDGMDPRRHVLHHPFGIFRVCGLRLFLLPELSRGALLFNRERLPRNDHRNHHVDQVVTERKVSDDQLAADEVLAVERLQDLVAAFPWVLAHEIFARESVVGFPVERIRRSVMLRRQPAHDHPAGSSIALIGILVASLLVSARVAPPISHPNELRLVPHDFVVGFPETVHAELLRDPCLVRCRNSPRFWSDYLHSLTTQ